MQSLIQETRKTYRAEAEHDEEKNCRRCCFAIHESFHVRGRQYNQREGNRRDERRHVPQVRGNPERVQPDSRHHLRA